MLCALTQAVGSADLPARVRSLWAGVGETPGDDRPRLDSCDARAAAARIAADVRSGAGRAWGVLGVGRL